MTSPRPRRIATSSAVGYGLALTLAVLGLVGRVALAHRQGASWFEVVSALFLILGGVLLLTVLLFELYGWLIRTRTRALTREHPGAFIATTPTDPALVASANAFALASTGERTRLVASSYMAIVADREAVRFVRGWRRPHVVAQFPAAVIERVEIGSAPAGVRMIPTVDLVCRDGQSHGRISAHIMAFRKGVPGFVRDQDLDEVARRLAAATGSAVGLAPAPHHGRPT
jgi:ABC-type nickel/cobalt efflux system permease component RcnA